MADPKRKHRRKSEDPLVAINGARVRAAIEWKGESINGAAGRIKVSQQTLDSIVRGKTSRCYESLRQKLATLVDLPAEWLGGETDLLPTLTPWVPLPELGYTPPLWVDENMRIVRPALGGDLTRRATLPPRYQLAANEICHKILEAWKRDIRRANPEAKAALSRLAKGQWKDRPWHLVLMLVTRLVSAFWWRRMLLKSLSLRESVDPKRFSDAEWRALGERIMRENEQRAAEELETGDQFAAASVSALTALLGPWFAGDRQLSYKSFVGMLEWANTFPQKET